MELSKAIKSRTSVRKFKSKKPDWRDILECIDSIKYSPMAGSIFTIKAILVKDQEKIQKLSEASQQPFIANAQYLVAICSNPSRTANAYGKRGETYCRQQAGAAIQTLLLRLVEKGLATCWVGHFVDEQVKSILGIPKDINVEALLPIGYALDKTRTRKAKTELDNFLFFDKYGNKKMNKVRRIDS